MLAQFEHLSDTYFVNADVDVGERELDFASQIDYDLDTFFATLGLAKSSLESAMNDDGTTRFFSAYTLLMHFN